MEDIKNRKTTRLQGFDYNRSGAYFITICTENRKQVLSKIVGVDVLDDPSSIGFAKPHVELLPYGKIVDKYIKQLDAFYDDISVRSYVIMPNHIHVMLFVFNNGSSMTSTPTKQHTAVTRFVSTFKRFCNKEYGFNIWQRSFNDHIIRSRTDYEEHMKYIHENPVTWYYDDLYSKE